VPGYRLLSPRVDPDLLRLVRRPRPNIRREAPKCAGELPIPSNPSNVFSHARRALETYLYISSEQFLSCEYDC
ncbi:hypothetical protein GCK32_010102, partial [Trichostrongylus colubriformis]